MRSGWSQAIKEAYDFSFNTTDIIKRSITLLASVCHTVSYTALALNMHSIRLSSDPRGAMFHNLVLVTVETTFNTLAPKQNGRQISNIFPWQKLPLSLTKFQLFSPDGTIQNKSALMYVFWALTRLQATFRTKAEPVHWCILTSQCVKCIDAWTEMLTHWGPDKMAAISQTTLSNPFSWMKMFELKLKFHWSWFPRVQLTIFHHWFR